MRFAGRLGIALARVGDIDRAEEAFLLALDHGELAACNDYAILLTQESRFNEAVPLLRRAADAGDPQAAANLVELLFEYGDLRAALQIAERYADESRPDTVVALALVRAASRPGGRGRGALPAGRRSWARCGHTARTARSCSRCGATRRRPSGSSGRPPGTTSTAGSSRWASSWSTTAVRWRPARTSPSAAALGDDEAVRLLAEIDGEDPYDD